MGGFPQEIGTSGVVHPQGPFLNPVLNSRTGLSGTKQDIAGEPLGSDTYFIVLEAADPSNGDPSDRVCDGHVAFRMSS